jgi:hypothetical protein
VPWLAKLTPSALASPAPQTVATGGFIHSYVRWRVACEHVSRAHRHWLTSEPAQRCLAFKGYLVALDREEHAARMHSYWTERFHAAA